MGDRGERGSGLGLRGVGTGPEALLQRRSVRKGPETTEGDVATQCCHRAPGEPTPAGGVCWACQGVLISAPWGQSLVKRRQEAWTAAFLKD